MTHASAPNMSDTRRVGCVFRYIAGDVYQTASDADSASLIRGRNRTGKFEHEPMPRTDLDPDALAYHRPVNEDRQAVYFR